MSSRRHSHPPPNSPPKPLPARPVRPTPRLAWALGLILLLATGSVGVWYWQQYARSGPAHDRQARQDIAEGKPAEAEQEWRQGVREDPSYAPGQVHLADFYLQARRFPEAVTAYQAAAKLTPTDGLLFLHWNRADLAVHDLKGAEATAKRAAELRPDDPDAVGLYGLLEAKQDNHAPALAALRRAHTLRPDDPDYLLELVRLEIEDVAFAQAQADLAPYLQAHPTDYWACHLMAVIFELNSHDPAGLQTALGYAQRAQAGLPADPRVYMALGDLYLDLHRPADALKAFQTGQTLLPGSEAMLHGLVRSYNALGNRPAAGKAGAALQVIAARHQRIPFLKQQMVLHPGDVVSGLALARLQEADGKPAAALALLKDLILKDLQRKPPRDPRLPPALADFYRRHARPDLAARALRGDVTP